MLYANLNSLLIGKTPNAQVIQIHSKKLSFVCGFFSYRFGEPEFRIMDECWIHYPISYLLPKNSSYTDSINRKLFQLRESGLVDDLITREMDKMSKMFQVRNLVASQKRLTLADLYEPFLILVIGLSLAFIAFLFECTSHKLGTRRQLRQN